MFHQMKAFMKRPAVILTLLGILVSSYIWSRQRIEPTSRVDVEKILKSTTNPLPDDMDHGDSVFFCGELIPLHDSLVNAKYERELGRLVNYKSSTRLLIRRSDKWLPLMERILVRYGVPKDFKYLAVIESNLSNVKSPKGAAGYWQLLPSTARAMGLRVDDEVDERNDPLKATEAACRYFRHAHKQLGNWSNVAASYNMGVAGLKRQLSSQEEDSYYRLRLNRETARYVYKAVAFKQVIENQEKFGLKEMTASAEE